MKIKIPTVIPPCLSFAFSFLLLLSLQFNIVGEFNEIELLNNSHIQTTYKVENGITRMLAYSFLNESNA